MQGVFKGPLLCRVQLVVKDDDVDRISLDGLLQLVDLAAAQIRSGRLWQHLRETAYDHRAGAGSEVRQFVE